MAISLSKVSLRIRPTVSCWKPAGVKSGTRCILKVYNLPDGRSLINLSRHKKNNYFYRAKAVQSLKTLSFFIYNESWKLSGKHDYNRNTSAVIMANQWIDNEGDRFRANKLRIIPFKFGVIITSGNLEKVLTI